MLQEEHVKLIPNQHRISETLIVGLGFKGLVRDYS